MLLISMLHIHGIWHKELDFHKGMMPRKLLIQNGKQFDNVISTDNWNADLGRKKATKTSFRCQSRMKERLSS